MEAAHHPAVVGLDERNRMQATVILSDCTTRREAASLGHRLFAGYGVKVWLLEVGNDVLNFTLMGAILVAIG